MFSVNYISSITRLPSKNHPFLAVFFYLADFYFNAQLAPPSTLW